MSYWTNRTQASGYRDAYRYTVDNIVRMRRNIGQPAAIVHTIGGIGDKTTTGDIDGMMRGAAEQAVIGGSLYDWRTTGSGPVGGPGPSTRGLNAPTPPPDAEHGGGHEDDDRGGDTGRCRRRGFRPAGWPAPGDAVGRGGGGYDGHDRRRRGWRCHRRGRGWWRDRRPGRGNWAHRPLHGRQGAHEHAGTRTGAEAGVVHAVHDCGDRIGAGDVGRGRRDAVPAQAATAAEVLHRHVMRRPGSGRARDPEADGLVVGAQDVLAVRGALHPAVVRVVGFDRFVAPVQVLSVGAVAQRADVAHPGVVVHVGAARRQVVGPPLGDGVELRVACQRRNATSLALPVGVVQELGRCSRPRRRVGRSPGRRRGRRAWQRQRRRPSASASTRQGRVLHPKSAFRDFTPTAAKRYSFGRFTFLERTVGWGIGTALRRRRSSRYSTNLR